MQLLFSTCCHFVIVYDGEQGNNTSMIFNQPTCSKGKTQDQNSIIATRFPAMRVFIMLSVEPYPVELIVAFYQAIPTIP